MADNVTVDNGALTDYVIASDDDGAAQHQYVKLEFGADGTQSIVEASNPLPVADDTNTDILAAAEAIQTSVELLDNAISGSELQVDVVTLPAVTGTVDLGATDNAVLDAIAASLVTVDGHVDGVEGLLTTIDADTSGIATSVDGIEALLTTIDVDTGNVVTSVQLLDNAVFVDDADFTDGTSSGYGVMAVAENTPTTVTDGDMGMLGMDPATRALKVSVQGTPSVNLGATDNAVLDSIAASVGTLDNAISGSEMQVDVVTLPAITGTVDLGATDNAVLDAIAASLVTVDGHVDGIEGLLTTIDADTGSILTSVDGIEALIGTTNSSLTTIDGRVDGIEALLTTIDADTSGIITATQLIDDMIFADDGNGFTLGTSKVGAMGAIADDTSTDSVDEGDIGIPRMTLDRKLITTVRPSATGEGLDVFRTLDADETEEDVKTSAGKVYGWFIYNDGAAEVYVKLYNLTAANTTVGSSTPKMTIPIPAGSAANVEFTNGILFDTAICIAATTAVSDGDSAAPAANQVIANILYK